MSDHTTGGTPDTNRQGELHDQLQDDLAPVREHREVFERAAAGDLDTVGESGAAICRVMLAVLDGDAPDPADVDVLDAFGNRDDEGRRVKRTFEHSLLAPTPQVGDVGDAVTPTSPRERRRSAIRAVTRRVTDANGGGRNE